MGRIVTWIVIAVFFAVILSPAVDFLERRSTAPGLAATVVFLIGFALIAAMIYTFIRPIVDQAQQFVDDLPEFVDDAEAGRGTVGELVQRYDIDEWVEENQDRSSSSATPGARAPDRAAAASPTASSPGHDPRADLPDAPAGPEDPGGLRST